MTAVSSLPDENSMVVSDGQKRQAFLDDTAVNDASMLEVQVMADDLLLFRHKSNLFNVAQNTKLVDERTPNISTKGNADSKDGR